MPYIEIETFKGVESIIKDLLEELDTIDEYLNYSRSIPRSFRVRFQPASTFIRDGLGSSMRRPIDLTRDDSSWAYGGDDQAGQEAGISAPHEWNAYQEKSVYCYETFDGDYR